MGVFEELVAVPLAFELAEAATGPLIAGFLKPASAVRVPWARTPQTSIRESVTVRIEQAIKAVFFIGCVNSGVVGRKIRPLNNAKIRGAAQRPQE